MKKQNLNLYIVIFAFIILNMIMVFSIMQKQQSKDEVLRLHVVANSNSISDQITKLKVATKLQDYIKSHMQGESKEKILHDVKEEANALLQISNTTLKQEQKQYASTLRVGKIEYDKKDSPTLTMENGVYDSIQVVLGDGEGKNFWSLIFPEQQDMETLQNLDSIMPGISHLYEEETISEKPQEKEYTFKLLEMIQNIRKS